MNDEIRMQISAFVDGELPENEAELLLRRMSREAQLRQEVAEYLALGRLIRSEEGLSGADRLHERVSAEIGERVAATDTAEIARPDSRVVKTMAGFAIAATVALAAIFALQQTGNVDEQNVAAPPTTAAVGETPQGVPSLDAQLEQQRELFRRHHDTSSRFGYNVMNSRVVDLRFSEVLDEDAVLEEVERDGTDVDDEKNTVTQP